MQSPKLFFEARVEEAILKGDSARKKFNRLAFLRLLAFSLSVGGFWYWSDTGEGVWGWGGFFLLGLFLVLMRAQQQAGKSKEYYKNLESVNRDELGRLSFEFVRDEGGNQFGSALHPYQGDLDIFGRHSLFRMMNRTRTAEGGRVLSEWLLSPAHPDEILLRQEALAEVRKDPEWLQKWQATAMGHKYSAQQIGSLYDWVQQPVDEKLKKLLPFRWSVLFTLSAAILWSTGVWPSWPFWTGILVHGFLLRFFNDYLRRLSDQTYRLGKTLAAYLKISHLTPGGGNSDSREAVRCLRALSRS